MFRILFYEPRIPGNTGNAIRLAAGTGCGLHLVEPLGFDMSESKLRRAGLDYHDLASVTVHSDLDAAMARLDAPHVYAFTAQAARSYADVAYVPGDVLMFGPEPTGLPEQVMASSYVTERVHIPMLEGRRSMNITNAAAVAAYEAWRQHDFAR